MNFFKRAMMPLVFDKQERGALSTMIMLGKSVASIVASGGWETLSGNFTQGKWKNSGDIFKDFSLTQQETTYETELIYACIRKLATSASEAPIKVGMETKEGWQDLPDHPLSALLKNPNPRMSYSEFIEYFTIHYNTTGKSYVWKWRDGLKGVAELWPIPTSWVTEVYATDGTIAYYELFQGPGRQGALIDPADMFCKKNPNAHDLTSGLSPVNVLNRSLIIEDERQNYMAEIMLNLKQPGLIFRQPEGWDEPERELVRQAIMNGLGRGNRGKPLFLSGEGADIIAQAPLKDFDWPGLSNLIETRVCSVFGVPPILIGLRSGLDTATYSNYEMALKAFFQSTMVPYWKALDNTFTRGLLASEGDTKAECYHDLEEVQALQEDRDKVVERALKELQAGAITLNQYNKKVGMDPLPPEQGDVYLRGISVVEVPANGSRVPPKDDGSGNTQQ